MGGGGPAKLVKSQLFEREKINSSLFPLLRKVKLFQNADINLNQKWKLLKKETGQLKFTTPQVIIESSLHHTGQEAIAGALNRQYVRKVKLLTQEMESKGGDPMVNYRKIIPPGLSKLQIQTINMHQLRAVLRLMKATGSMGKDDLSVRTIKAAQPELEPLLLRLVNQTILKTTYPERLKTTKIVPVEKKGKDKQTSDGWRPINVIGALSKIIERVILKQLIEHLDSNKIVSNQHHGAVKDMSTQTLISELHDRLVDSLTKQEESALIIIDQSKAYEVVNHEILLKKLQAIGCTEQAISIFRSFLTNRKQYVQIQAHKSDKILTGPQSVIQGSSLSCALYLVYILDMPSVFHSSSHTPMESRKCAKPDLKTFVDDAYVHTVKVGDKTMTQTITETMKTIETYMDNNKLKLNQDKTQILLLTKDTNLKKQFQIQLGGKNIKHQNNVTILGNTMTDQLTWDTQINKNLIPSLQNRLRTLRKINKYLDPQVKKTYTNSIFRSKMFFGI